MQWSLVVYDEILFSIVYFCLGGTYLLMSSCSRMLARSNASATCRRLGSQVDSSRKSLEDCVPQAVAEAAAIGDATQCALPRYVVLTCGHRFVVIKYEKRFAMTTREYVLPQDKKDVGAWLEFLYDECVKRLKNPKATLSHFSLPPSKRPRGASSSGGSSASGGRSGDVARRGGHAPKRSRSSKGKGPSDGGFKMPHGKAGKRKVFACGSGSDGNVALLTANALKEHANFDHSDVLSENVFRLIGTSTK
jgi:hypothetical protein